MAALFESAAPAPTPIARAESDGDAARGGDLAAGAARTRARSRSTRESSPIDLLGDDALEADVLDDDAFFATLREAVHDDTPLGPRDEDDDNLDFFNDDNGDRAVFRDVFRRRR